MADIVQSGYTYAAVIQPYMPIFYTSFMATLLLTPLMRVLAHRHGIVDDPDHRRKVHTRPIAYLGGVSIFLGWVAGVTISVFLTPHNAGPGIAEKIQIPPGILLGAATVVFFGLMDDVYSVSPKVKIFGQLLAALFLILPTPEGLNFFMGRGRGPAWMILDALTFPTRAYLPPDWAANPPPLLLVIAAIFSGLVVIMVIVSACNATNLLDGLDGLCSGVTGVMSLGYLILAVHLASLAVVFTQGGGQMDPIRITISLALLGAVMGFLPYNFNPASIFMGDTGSMFLGYICGTMILLFAQSGTIRWFLSAIVIFGLPMMDTFLAIVRRRLNKKPVFSPDSNHFHHFLIRRGLSVRKAVLLSYLVAAIFVSFALIIVITPTRVALGIYLVLFGYIVVAAFKMGMIFQHSTPVVENTQLNLAVLHSTPDSATSTTPISLTTPAPDPAEEPAAAAK